MLSCNNRSAVAAHAQHSTQVAVLSQVHHTICFGFLMVSTMLATSCKWASEDSSPQWKSAQLQHAKVVTNRQDLGSHSQKACLFLTLLRAQALNTPLVLRQANSRPLLESEKAMNGPSARLISPCIRSEGVSHQTSLRCWQPSSCRCACRCPPQVSTASQAVSRKECLSTIRTGPSEVPTMTWTS